MDANRTFPTPQEAREQLEQSRERRLPTPADRSVHAWATAVFGLSLGLLMAPRNLLSGTGQVLVAALFIACWIGAEMWVDRTARTVPRRARLWSRLGIGTSFVLALIAVLPWLNFSAQSRPNTVPMVLLAGLVIATPSLIAAIAIGRSRR